MTSRHWLFAGILLSGSALAVPQYGPGMGMGPGGMMPPGMGPAPYMRPPMPAPAMPTPAVALRNGVDRLLAFLGSEEAPSAEQLAAFLDSEIAPFFDFEHMAKAAGGRFYEQLDDEGRAKLVAQIKESFLGKMAEKLGSYDEQQVRFLPPRGSNDGRTAQVSVAILNPGSYPARLDFRLYDNNGRWLVFDVSANGQSAIVHYRNQIMREERQQMMEQMRRMQQPMQPPARPMQPPVGPQGYPMPR